MTTNFWEPAVWKKLFMMYYEVNISEQFIACGNTQLAIQFEKITGIEITGIMRLSWESGEKLLYEKGKISKLGSGICLKYGIHPVTILWESKSGRIYDIADTDILCDDIQFWFERLDPEWCRHRMFPKWSLFTFPEAFINSFEKTRGLKISPEFIACADKQLSAFFEKETGIRLNKHICMFESSAYGEVYYHKAAVSRLSSRIYINISSNSITIAWESKSDRIYDIADTDIDFEDIRFWLEGIDAVLYHKQLYPGEQLPFKLKGLTYELVINRLNVDVTITMSIKSGHLDQAASMTEAIDIFINNFNERSLRLSRKYGIIHNWSSVINDYSLVYDVDTGSAGAYFYKKLLIFLSGLNGFQKIDIS